MNIETITSRANPLVKHLRRLGKDRDYRRSCGEMLCEGGTLLEEALSAGVRPTVVLSQGTIDYALPPETRVIRADESLMNSVSTLKTPPELVFSCPAPDRSLRMGRKGLILDGLQDPGNIGSILRSAAAFGADSIILTPDCADVAGPKAVRASMGLLFRQIVCEASAEAVLAQARQSGVALYAADAGGEAVEWVKPGGYVVIGNEGHGISPVFRELPKVSIPMSGHCESLGAAVAAALMLWEMRAW